MSGSSFLWKYDAKMFVMPRSLNIKCISQAKSALAVVMVRSNPCHVKFAKNKIIFQSSVMHVNKKNIVHSHIVFSEDCTHRMNTGGCFYRNCGDENARNANVASAHEITCRQATIYCT